MTELEQHIKSSFGLAQPEDIKMIVSLFKPTTIKKGGFFLKSGRQCDKLSFPSQICQTLCVTLPTDNTKLYRQPNYDI